MRRSNVMGKNHMAGFFADTDAVGQPLLIDSHIAPIIA